MTEPGQVWKSTDRRQCRRVQVVECDGHFATVEPVGGGRRSRVRVDAQGRLSRYRLDEVTGDP